jgi:hypothetical protein
MLWALADAIAETDEVVVTSEFGGVGDWLVLYGIGRPPRDEWRKDQIASGGHVLLTDLGYFGRQKITGYLRVSIDQDHPQKWLDRTAPDPSRWNELGIKLRQDYATDGHIILAGLGRKSWIYYGEGWEYAKLTELRERFPSRRIIYRPKPGSPALNLKCDVNEHSSIEELLRGAALVVCRQSNVAVDAIVAGVPYECEDGAAMWLKNKPYTRENRTDFLQRLSCWQYRPTEARECWAFVKAMVWKST